MLKRCCYRCHFAARVAIWEDKLHVQSPLKHSCNMYSCNRPCNQLEFHDVAFDKSYGLSRKLSDIPERQYEEEKGREGETEKKNLSTRVKI